MRLNEKFNHLKKGDNVTTYYDYATDRRNPQPATITSIGREYIHVVDEYGNKSKYHKNGYGEYGKYIFPGSVDELNEHFALTSYRREVVKAVDNAVKDMTKEELDAIMNIVNR